MKYLARILVAMLFVVNSYAQEVTLTQTVRGVVVDNDIKQPLIGVLVAINYEGERYAVSTDFDGTFSLEKVPVGRHEIACTYMGYENKRLTIVVSAAKEVVLNIQMTELITEIESIEITRKPKGQAKNEDASVSARGFDVEETKRYAGSLADPARMASSFAGVATNPDGNNDIIVRGNSPRGVLWRIEGVEAPNPNHFSSEGASGGPISIINSNMLANSDFYTGAFPSEFGNAYSGVFDINLRQGNSEKREHTVQLSILGTEIGSEGPFSKDGKSSYNANYRYSTLELMQNMGVEVAESALPKYQDATFKLRFPSQKHGVLSVYGVGGISSVDYVELDEKDNDKEYFKGSASNKMGVLGVSHLIFMGDNTHLKSSLVYNGRSNVEQSDALNRQDEFYNFYENTLDYQDVRLNVLLQHKLSAKHVVTSGVNYTQKFFNLNLKHQNIDEEVQRTLVDQSGNTGISQAYVNWKYRPTNELTIIGGVHHMRLHLNNEYAIEPRLGMRYKLTDKQTLKAGVGVHSRIEPISTYYTLVENDESISQPNNDLGFTKARHYVVGYENQLTKNVRWSVEAYYQDLYDVPVVNDASSSVSLINLSEGFVNDDLVNKGSGENYGIEMTVERFFANQYYFLVTASLYESKYTAMDGVKRDTRYNGNAVLNVLAGKEFDVSRNGKKKFFTISTKGAYAGGNRYTPIDLVASQEMGEEVNDATQPFGIQSKSYTRFDLQLSLRINKKKTTREWKLDIQNVTNTSNIVGHYYDPYTKRVEEFTQLGLLPVLSYKVEF